MSAINTTMIIITSTKAVITTSTTLFSMNLSMSTNP